jgi:hypothetical protein
MGRLFRRNCRRSALFRGASRLRLRPLRRANRTLTDGWTRAARYIRRRAGTTSPNALARRDGLPQRNHQKSFALAASLSPKTAASIGASPHAYTNKRVWIVDASELRLSFGDCTSPFGRGDINPHAAELGASRCDCVRARTQFESLYLPHRSSSAVVRPLAWP